MAPLVSLWPLCQIRLNHSLSFKPFVPPSVLAAWIIREWWPSTAACTYHSSYVVGDAQFFKSQNCAAVVLVIASAPTLYSSLLWIYTPVFSFLRTSPFVLAIPSLIQILCKYWYYYYCYALFLFFTVLRSTVCTKPAGRAVPLFLDGTEPGYLFILRGHRSLVGTRLIQALSVRIEGFCGRGLQRVLEVDTEVRRIAVIQPRCHLSRLGYLNLLLFTRLTSTTLAASVHFLPRILGCISRVFFYEKRV